MDSRWRSCESPSKEDAEPWERLLFSIFISFLPVLLTGEACSSDGRIGKENGYQRSRRGAVQQETAQRAQQNQERTEEQYEVEEQQDAITTEPLTDQLERRDPTGRSHATNTSTHLTPLFVCTHWSIQDSAVNTVPSVVKRNAPAPHRANSDLTATLRSPSRPSSAV